MSRILLFLALYCSAAGASGATSEFRDGDIIFHTSRSSQSVAIQRATKSPYSHMGIIFFRGSKPFVFEAASTVEFTPLSEWIARGVGGRCVVKRLTDASSRLTPSAVAKLSEQARRIRGKRYDPAFEWTDKRFYCSELVWKLYERALGIQLGSPQRLGDFDLTDPVVVAKVRERYGNHVPLDERVISPAAIFDSPELTVVSAR